jgi:hypothetical protein
MSGDKEGHPWEIDGQGLSQVSNTTQDPGINQVESVITKQKKERD